MDAKTGELRIFVPAYRQRLTIRAAVINVGRADPELGFKPELDLTPFGGLEKGVSRRHATIQWDGRGYVLIDQHSSNGTWLEGVRLAVGQAHRLPPRAAVRFGDLLVQLSTAD
jgi:pSer/pThr/pTyr-binding forkhead associated (FHA) protein